MAEPGNQACTTSLRFRDDAAADEPAVIARRLPRPDRTPPRCGSRRATTCAVLLPHLDRVRLVEVDFPTFRDGRGFSAARILREAGYTGEIKATGDVLVDLLFFMRRCGFDSFAPDVPLDPADVEAALDR